MGLSGEQRKQMTGIRKLIKSNDWKDVEQGIALLDGADDMALWDLMTEGVAISGDGTLGISEGEIKKRVKAAHRVSVALLVAQRSGWLRYQKNLRVFTAKQAVDFSGFSLPDSITSLKLSCWTARDFGPLKQFSHLTSLDLSGCKSVRDLSFLQGLKNLASLDLSGCYAVSDLGPLKDLQKLTTLRLSGLSVGNNIQALRGLTRLQSLDLSYIKNLDDLTPLETLTDLTTLDLSWSKSVRDVSPLKKLTNLTNLCLSNGNANLPQSEIIALHISLKNCKVER